MPGPCLIRATSLVVHPGRPQHRGKSRALGCGVAAAAAAAAALLFARGVVALKRNPLADKSGS